MSRKPLRFVLGFYSAEEGDPEAAFKALRESNRAKVFLFRPDAPSAWESPSIQRYSALLLEGETLLAAEAAPSEVEAVVKRFQGAGSPAVFVLRSVVRDDFADPADTGAPATPQPSGKASFLERLHQ